MSSLHHFFFVFLCLCTRLVTAARVNRTIDDTNGDSATGQVPIYRPVGAWDGVDCSTCSIKPSTSEAFDGTWTAATYNSGLGSSNIYFSFEGVALYIYFILANDQGSGITTRTECNFTLDDMHAGFFNHTPSSSTALEYNALAFSVTGLEQKAHSMVISTSGVSYNVWVNFDYANYVYDEDAATASGTATSTSSSSSTTSSSDSSSTSGSGESTGAIVGGVVGGLAALAALGLAVFFFLKRRHRTHIPSHDIDDDDGQPPMSMITDRYGHHHNHSQSLLPLASASDYNRDPAHTEYNPFNTSYADHDRSSSYIPRDVVSSLPSGAIVMSAAAASRTTIDASSASGLPAGAAAPASSIHSDRTGSSVDQTDLRRTRQQALQAQMRAIQNEIAGTINAGGSSERRDEEMDDLKAQVAAMREQMKTLQTQLQSPWAQGLSDEPPPGYTQAQGEVVAPLASRRKR